MVVFVVVRCIGAGQVLGVFSTLDKATDYIDHYKYESYIITEHIVDKVE